MRTCLVILLLLFRVQFFGQDTIGVPDIINYSKDNYNSGTSSWDIVQDKNDIVYFANNEGLLSFDCTYWNTYTLPNKTMLRSVAIGSDDRIYCGNQGDFGYFSPDENGRLIYSSLKPLLSEKNKAFQGIWDIVPFENEGFFRTDTRIFQYSNNTVNVFPAAKEWRFLGLHNNTLIAQDSRNGLMEFEKGIWKQIVKLPLLPPDFLVTAIVPLGKDSSLITTLKSGLFVLSGNNISQFESGGLTLFSNERILNCIPVNNDWIAIGTQLNGCYIINKKAEIIQSLSREEGLQNNCVLSLCLDKNKNLWLGLDYGIAFIAYNNAIKHIYPERLNEGAGYSSIIYQIELYIGTSNGLYKVPVSDLQDLSFVNGNFQPVPVTKAPAWGLYEVNGNLLMAHHDGAFRIKNDAAVPVNNRMGYFTFLPYYNVLPSSLVVAGNYLGLDFLQYDQNGFVSRGNLAGFTEGAQFVFIDNNNLIWVGELLEKIKEELVHLKNGNGNENSSGDLKKIIRVINDEDKMDKDWEHFTIHFDKVHGDFLRELMNRYPTLSAYELKLCAYLRMNLSSKEIARLMNISVRGVEISRYRLRKKFQIATETNLFNFLMEFTSHREHKI